MIAEGEREQAAGTEPGRRMARVEVGCIGGLGRPGTVLACMAILAGIAPEYAVQWVRDHYDPVAVEIPEQL